MEFQRLHLELDLQLVLRAIHTQQKRLVEFARTIKRLQKSCQHLELVSEARQQDIQLLARSNNKRQTAITYLQSVVSRLQQQQADSERGLQNTTSHKETLATRYPYVMRGHVRSQVKAALRSYSRRQQCCDSVMIALVAHVVCDP